MFGIDFSPFLQLWGNSEGAVWLAPATPLLLLMGLALDWLIGDMRWFFKLLPHPVVMIGKLIGFLDRKLNREGRGDINRTVRGAVVCVLVTLVAAAVGWGIQELTRQHSSGWMVDVFLVAVLVAQRSLAGRVGDVGKALAKKDLLKARDNLRHLVSRDPDKLDRHGVGRSALESLAENFSDAVVAPAFWFLVLGLPGLFAYKAINTMDSMIGYRTDRYISFGMTAARLDDAVNWIPARLAGLYFVIGAAFAPGGNPARALKVMLRDARKHASPNAGWPEAAMAGAFNFALGGPRVYAGGAKTESVWIGDGKARLEAGDVRRGLALFVIGCGLLWLTAAPLAILSLAG